jgi:hypothetical protein
VSEAERIRVAMQAKLNAAGYILMDSASSVDDWDEYGAAVGLNPSGAWAFVAWLNEATCPSCSGSYEAEITNCRSEEQAKVMLAQFRKAHS